MKIYYSPNASDGQDENMVLLRADIDRADLHIEETPSGYRFELDGGFRSINEPGTPALPAKIVEVALPYDASEVVVKTVVHKSTKLFSEPVFILPVSEPVVAMAADSREPRRADQATIERLKPVFGDREVNLRSVPSVTRNAIPDPEKYNAYLRNPTPLARVSGVIVEGGNKVVCVAIQPVTLDQNLVPELNLSFEVRIHFTRSREVKYARNTTVRPIARDPEERRASVESLKDRVLNPAHVIDVSTFNWGVLGSYDYIVITDNNRWDSDRMAAVGAVGDMVTPFQKLVDWKRQKGRRARVVTITDIVNNVYGDFKTTALDLQEVVRNFMKWAQSQWGVCWCLLGGDTDIIPVRQAAGECRGDVSEQAAHSTPEDNEAFWTGTFMKIKAVSFGEWFSIHDSYLKLTNKNTGRLIPKKAPRGLISLGGISAFGGASARANLLFETTAQFRARLGWYFCTDNTYMTYSAAPTNFVRVDGPAAIVRAPLRWHYTWNTIPTDFYYSSLTGPNYGVPGRHDWDANGNGIYGQHEGTNQFDPINWHSDVCVGRAPASTPAQADTFVSKVIAYEKFRAADGTSLDRNYLDKMLLVSSNWGGRIGFWSTTSNPPEAGRFNTQAAQNRAVLQTTADTVLDWNWQLISWVSDTDVWIIPYNRNAAPGIRGWYYAFSPTDLRPAIFTFPLPWGSVQIPLITHTIVIYGNASDIAPNAFILDSTQADGSMMDQEALRTQVDSDIAVIQRFNRLYEDIDSLPLANRMAAPVARLTSAALESALDEGQHFLSLSGHGSQGGCCLLHNGRAASITNRNRCFIAWADSCLTNAFESNDAMSEDLLNNANGGAVAYVGHTRFSWIGLGDDYERAFFHRLVFTRRLGDMFQSRLTLLAAHPNDHYQKWTVLALNLLGDPEMEVWKAKPRRIIPDIFAYDRLKLYLKVYDREDFAREPLPKYKAVVSRGESVLQTELASDGFVHLDAQWLERDGVQLTIQSDNAPPYVYQAQELRAMAERLLRSEEEAAMAGIDESQEQAAAGQETLPSVPGAARVVELPTQQASAPTSETRTATPIS